MIYLDNSATTKPYTEVVEYIAEVSEKSFGNPSSLHRLGMDAEKVIITARERVSSLLCCRTDELYFTSGGTESDNIAVLGTVLTKKNAGKRIVTTAIEHPAVKNAADFLKTQGFEVIYVTPKKEGICEGDILKEITPDTVLVSLMQVNNETGEILPLSKIRERMKEVKSRGLFHIDAVQSFGKLDNILTFSPDLVSISSHKIHGPRGAGGLYIKKGINFVSPVFGGGQEKNIRSGTENTPAIAGFGKACEIKEKSLKTAFSHVKELCRYLEKSLLSLDLDIKILKPENHLPYVLNFAVPALKSEVLLHFLEGFDIFISSGSACSSRKNKQSRVLMSYGLSPDLADSSLRISFSEFNTKEDIDSLTKGLISGYNNLKHK